MRMPLKIRMAINVGKAAKRTNGSATGSPFMIRLNCSVSG